MIIDIGPNLANAINGFFEMVACIIIFGKGFDFLKQASEKWDGNLEIFKRRVK